jgi:hypothetical protein
MLVQKAMLVQTCHQLSQVTSCLNREMPSKPIQEMPPDANPVMHIADLLDLVMASATTVANRANKSLVKSAAEEAQQFLT